MRDLEALVDLLGEWQIHINFELFSFSIDEKGDVRVENGEGESVIAVSENDLWSFINSTLGKKVALSQNQLYVMILRLALCALNKPENSQMFGELLERESFLRDVFYENL